MQTFETVVRRAATLTELNVLFGREVRAFGFTAYAAGFIPRRDAGKPDAERDPFLLLDWPRAWLELYARQGFAEEDAVIAAAQHATEPFTWRQLQGRQPGASARIFAAARAFGWNDGLLVPVPERAHNRIGVISLAAPGLDHLNAGELGRVEAICLFAFARALDLPREGAPPTALTPREREVLVLVARGYDDAEIGAALGLTKTTAHSYVERAKRRLGATTRAQAVALALSTGVIEAQLG